MFRKEYPRNCTVFGTIFEDCYNTGNRSSLFYNASGHWNDYYFSGIFSVNIFQMPHKQGFRVGIYVS
jgi:hypothetical protein